jgi:hypothetical protein
MTVWLPSALTDLRSGAYTAVSSTTSHIDTIASDAHMLRAPIHDSRRTSVEASAEGSREIVDMSPPSVSPMLTGAQPPGIGGNPDRVLSEVLTPRSHG